MMVVMTEDGERMGMSAVCSTQLTVKAPLASSTPKVKPRRVGVQAVNLCGMRRHKVDCKLPHRVAKLFQLLTVRRRHCRQWRRLRSGGTESASADQQDAGRRARRHSCATSSDC